ncbi:Lipopolysaccharide biosynthesis protein WzxC [Planococcus massiliensis]|uniref:Lipopolysaccharide biosynthesis protein WzxC n=1 Tax=Planococcus massiliensis TaxID=1499687 RepID=A0A098EJW0_9BACL|nr:MOP flippase family protein [Planococcus massiliensis]CEG22110.1 Lipopolysaccharide biosynthesis protein WzxC [Planococcus massiliensis]
MSSLKKKVAASMKLTSLSMLITSLLQIVQLVVLGRILGPAVYGILALVQIVIQFAQMYMDMGLTDAIIQKEKISKIQLSSLYWVSIFTGIGIFILLFFAAPLLASLFDHAELKGMIQVVGISFVIIPFGLQFQTIASKNLEFSQITKNEIAASFIGVSLTIFLAAFMAAGAWSLVFGHIASSLVRTVPWAVAGFRNPETRPALVFSWKSITELIVFGLYRLGTTTANYFNTKIDQIIIGILMGPQILGIYSMAMNLIMQPIQKLNPMITRVSFPVFAKIQQDQKRLQKAYLFIIQLIMTLNAPFFSGLIVLAPFLVPLLLGKEWTEAIVIVQILCFYALFRALGNPSGSLFTAVGKVRWSFYWQLGLLFIVPVVVYFSSLTGELAMVALAMGLLRFVLFFINYFSRIRLIIGNSFNELMKSIFVPIFHSVVMILLLQGLIGILAKTNDIAIILISFCAGLLIYGFLMMMFQKKLLLEVKSFFIQKAEKRLA